MRPWMLWATVFFLTPGQSSDLQGADVLLPQIEAQAVLADKAYDAQERVLTPLIERDIEVVIPPKKNRVEQRPYDKVLYQARHLIENFFAKLSRLKFFLKKNFSRESNFVELQLVMISVLSTF